MFDRRELLRMLPSMLLLSSASSCRWQDTLTEGTTKPDDDTSTDGETTDDATSEASCSATASDIEGPFYRPNAPERTTLLSAAANGARPLTLSGRVLRVDGCTPVAGAVVEFWQADAAGAYDNDSSEMRGRGRVTTDGSGRWSVETYEPGRYLNGSRYRPAHLHVKLWIDGQERLTTQLYFPGDPYNAQDSWYSAAREVVRTGETTARFDFVV